jgi:putative membrane protein
MDVRFGFDGGFGIVALIWLLIVVAFWVLVIAGLVLGVRWLIRAERNSRNPNPPASGSPSGAPSGAGAPTLQPDPRPHDPLEILRQRYARGEIDEDEYERRRRTLSGV